jgi:hypothetical protein
MNFFSSFKRIITLDLRALALMRIGIGLLLLLDLTIRASDLKAHYTNDGVLPLPVLLQNTWHPWNLSIHLMSGLWQVQVLLFILAAGFAICLLIGYKPKLFAVLSWFFMMSLQNRNPLILQGGDDLLRLLLFWSIFLPMGERYAVSKMDEKKLMNIQNNEYYGLPALGYMVQIFCVYFFSALLKNSPEWTTDGTAIYYALSLDQMVFPLGKLIYPYGSVLKYLTFVVYYTELLVPFLLFVPYKDTFFKKVVICAFVMLHLSIALTLFVGLFFLIGIVSLIGLIPGSWMDVITHRGGLVFERIKYSLTMLWVPIYYHASSIKIKYNSSKIVRNIRNAGFILVMLFCVSWNLKNTHILKIKWNTTVEGIGQSLGLTQNWGMFAPGVFKDDGWYILEGKTKDNRLIDLNNGGLPVQYKKPAAIVSSFKNDRWRKYTENYLFISNTYMRPYFCDFKFKEWNESHPENTIKELTIVYMKEVTQPDYKYVQPTREVLAWVKNN